MSPKTILYLFLLATSLVSATSARLLDEVDPLLPPVIPSTLPSGQIPATTTTPLPSNDPPISVVADVAPIVPPVVDAPIAPPEDDAPVVDATVTPPVTDTSPIPTATDPTPIPTTVAPTAPGATVAPSGPGATVAPSGPGATVAPTGPSNVGATVAPAAGQTGARVAPTTPDPALSFFMHDILGGSRPSARVVTGIIANSDVNGIPFSKTNNNFFPVSGGVPLANNNLKGIINNNNLPYLAGLNGAQQQGSTVLQNSGNNNVVNGGGNLPFVTAGQLPAGATLQKLMFGSTTVVDDQLTESHELGSGVIGRAQGFYLGSSLDGTSQTVALTAIFHGDHDHDHDQLDDTISFFGVHRTASHGSQVAVIGGTGKYEDAKGYATIQALHQEDQHTTDGTDTILEFTVYLF